MPIDGTRMARRADRASSADLDADWWDLAAALFVIALLGLGFALGWHCHG
jgi:hypothetical protein